MYVGMHDRLKICSSRVRFPSWVLNINVMSKKKKKNIITVKEEGFKDSKFNTREWHQRVNIVHWEHDFEKKEYYITLE
jgi:hypothetical protein